MPTEATPSSPEANAGQRRYWSERAGPHWVERQNVFDTMLAPHGRALLDVLQPMRGERVLDVGCGFGTTALDVARSVGDEGGVHGVDLSSAMVERARERADAAGLGNATFQVGDAQVDPLAPHTPYDAATSRFGVMFFDNPVAAFTNVRAAVRPGGRLGFVCWQGAAANPFFTIGARVLLPALLEPPPSPDPSAPGPLAFADPERVRRVLAASGWSDIAVDGRKLPVRFVGDSDVAMATALDQLMSSDLGRIAARQLDSRRLAEVIEAACGELDQNRVDDGIQFDSAIWVVSATN
ncbi:MAG: class I SAM-dependent methyltransferase [Actinomycetota bacterium]|nr:class I SAM-dependent methyltransferase [Actinomycetota bacterium]